MKRLFLIFILVFPLASWAMACVEGPRLTKESEAKSKHFKGSHFSTLKIETLGIQGNPDSYKITNTVILAERPVHILLAPVGNRRYLNRSPAVIGQYGISR